MRSHGLAPGKLEGGNVIVSRLDAIKSKRAERFEFAEKPTAVRSGDQMTIRFAVTGSCEANTRIAPDDYGRSFAPAFRRYEVAVADTAGNIVLRIGQYGNVDDGVALASPKWLAVHSDRRLFVSDRGNYRILSVKLGYHAEEEVSPTDGGAN